MNSDCKKKEVNCLHDLCHTHGIASWPFPGWSPARAAARPHTRSYPAPGGSAPPSPPVDPAGPATATAQLRADHAGLRPQERHKADLLEHMSGGARRRRIPLRGRVPGRPQPELKWLHRDAGLRCANPSYALMCASNW